MSGLGVGDLSVGGFEWFGQSVWKELGLCGIIWDGWKCVTLVFENLEMVGV